MEQNSSKRYAVVSFPDEEDEGLFIVSTKWLIHNKSEDEYYCMWPPYKTDARIKNAVLEEETPTSAWQKSPAKLLKKCKSYAGGESFINAIMLVTKGRSRSEKRDQGEKRDQSEKRDCSSKHKKRSSSSKRIKLEVVSPVSSPAPCDSSSSSSEDSDTGVICDQSTAETDEPLNVGIPSTSRLTTVPNASAYQFLLESTPVLPQVLEVTGSEVYDPNGSLEEKVDYLARTVESVKKTVMSNHAILKKLDPDSQIYFDSQNMPASTFDELKRLNMKLSDKKEFQRRARQLGHMGGKSPPEVVRKVMGCLISNDVAMALNWIGGERKKSIQEFKFVIQLVFAAVRLNREFSHTTMADVEDSIKKWLRNSADRNGGRTRRKVRPLLVYT